MKSSIRKVLNLFTDPGRIIIILNNKYRILWPLPDRTYLKILYRLKIKHPLDLKNPKGFNEKIQWLKLNDRKDEYVIMVDKYLVKPYVSNIIGEQYIIPTLGVWDRFEDIDFAALPEMFVLKCTHDSGGLVICKDKSKFDYDKAKKKIEESLKTNYYRRVREWPYKEVERRIIAEPYMVDEKQNSGLIDYKFMCFNGRVRCIFTVTNRFSIEGIHVTFFDLKWNKLPFERHYKSDDIPVQKPHSFDKMIELSEKLSKNIPFARIDFYEIEDNPYFGEITLYPGSGLEEFNPQEWDLKLGDYLSLPSQR